MQLQTKRCVLRPWRESDAPALYACARDARVGSAAGWPVHTDVENSRQIIREVLSGEEVYAVVPREGGADRPAGNVGLLFGAAGNVPLAEGEAELGYWIGVPFWGQGLIPEAARALLRHGFADLGLRAIWCSCYEGNEKSRRVQEKCGFRFHHIDREQTCPLTGAPRAAYVSRITRGQWEQLCESGRFD